MLIKYLQGLFPVFFLLIGWFYPISSDAAVFPLPTNPNDSVVGELSSAIVQQGETLLDIGRAHDLGYEEIIKANSGVNRWVPEPGTRVVLPSRYVLP